MKLDDQRPKVGIGVVIFKDNNILLGKRKNANGDGENEYACPGGHLELMESFEDCAKRETKEEAGIEIENIRFLSLYNLTQYAPKHSVNIGLVADWKSGEPQNLEPHKLEGWDWYSLDNLPSPLYSAIPQYIEALRTGKNYFDA